MATNIYLGFPPPNVVKWIKDEAERKYQEILKTPLTFTAEEAGAKLRLVSQNGPAVTLETSPTGKEGSWQPYTGGTEITLANVGDKVMFRNSSDTIQVMGTSLSGQNQFRIENGKIAASGNIMFLMDKTGELRDLSGKDYCYYSLFDGCSSLTQAPTLPATTLAGGCYDSMFRWCTSLTQAPALPATTLADKCYRNMFCSCKFLTQAPTLPAKTLAVDCYRNMFSDCTALTQAPILPATTLAEGCYTSMFQICKSLTQAPTLPATTLADICYGDMFYNCTSLTQAPALPATTLADGCYRSMFGGCTSLTQSPTLPAITLAVDCYYDMFRDCTSLIKAPNIAKIDDNCNNMFYNTIKLEEITFTNMTTDEVVAIAKNACIGIPKGTVICYCTDGVVIVGAGDDSSGSGS